MDRCLGFGSSSQWCSRLKNIGRFLQDGAKHHGYHVLCIQQNRRLSLNEQTLRNIYNSLRSSPPLFFLFSLLSSNIFAMNNDQGIQRKQHGRCRMTKKTDKENVNHHDSSWVHLHHWVSRGRDPVRYISRLGHVAVAAARASSSRRLASKLLKAPMQRTRASSS